MHAQPCCASANPCQVQILGGRAPVVKLVRQIISAKTLQSQVQIFLFEHTAQVLYNINID